jgi:hypothetical protein
MQFLDLNIEPQRQPGRLSMLKSIFNNNHKPPIREIKL